MRRPLIHVIRLAFTFTVLACLPVLPAHADDLAAGRAAVEAGNYAEGLRLLTPLAEQGDAVAQRSLGWMYMSGTGVPKDLEQAEKWLVPAAAQGDEKARMNLLIVARLYRAGGDVTRRCTHAVEILNGLIAQGFVPAMVDLGGLYSEGCDEIRANEREAIRWVRESAERGDAIGQANLGAAYATGMGVKQDYAEALRWYRKSADQGSSLGQFGVGLLYYEGQGVKRDVEEAKKWFRLAAAQGEPRAVAAVQELCGEVPVGAQASMIRQAAMEASPADLAQSYAYSLVMQKMLKLAESGATVQLGDRKVDPSNAAAAANECRMGQDAFAEAIRARGFRNVSGRYRAASTDCGKAQSLWVSGLAAKDFREVLMTQDGFVVNVTQVMGGGPQTMLETVAAVAESAMSFPDPGNTDYYWTGTIEEGRITLRPDVEDILRAWPAWAHPPSRKDLADCVVTLTAIE